MNTNVPFTEPIAVPDTFVCGLGRIEKMRGGFMRFTFYTDQQSLHGCEQERVVVARIVMHSDLVAEANMAVRCAINKIASSLENTLVLSH